MNTDHHVTWINKNIIDVLIETRLATSKTDARRLIKDGAVKFDSECVKYGIGTIKDVNMIVQSYVWDEEESDGPYCPVKIMVGKHRFKNIIFKPSLVKIIHDKYWMKIKYNILTNWIY